MTQCCKPNFFIVGSAKAGTTSLANYLGQHPDVFISPVKEPFYFVQGYGLTDVDEYLGLFSGVGDRRAAGEASTGYLWDPGAAQRIYEFNPESRIVIILRRPENMAFSLWSYMRRQGNEQLDFLDAFFDHANRSSEVFRANAFGWYANYLYRDRAIYSPQVSRYLDRFGRERVEVLIFEDMIREPIDAVRRVCRFLEVDDAFSPQIARLNEGGLPRSSLIKAITQRQYPMLRRLLPLKARVSLRIALRGLNVKKATGPKLTPDLEAAIAPELGGDVKQLARLLQRPLWSNAESDRLATESRASPVRSE